MNIFVAYSGGTDSTYSLIKYKEAGHNVTAVHAQLAPVTHDVDEKIALLSSFCESQGINFLYVDYSKEFWDKVVEMFCNFYGEGKTPNPCALCNPQMKFGILRQYAFEHGADIFVTGHYTQRKEICGTPLLYPAVDETKDQSYFLSLVPQEAFINVEFPLGTRVKEDVRKELRTKGITPPYPSDSQEICFVPNDDYRSFLQEHKRVFPRSGDICLLDGTIVGRHNGLWQYTEGQRRGLAIAYAYPLYVLRKDAEHNILYVGSKEELMTTGCRAKHINICLPYELWGNNLFVRTRYRQKKVSASVCIEGEELCVTYKEPQESIACGQVLAVYNSQGAIVAGGILVR